MHVCMQIVCASPEQGVSRVFEAYCSLLMPSRHVLECCPLPRQALLPATLLDSDAYLA